MQDQNVHSALPKGLQKNKGFTRIYKAAYYSYRGLRLALCSESAFQQELVLALLLVPLAFWLDVTAVERVLLIGAIVLVLIVELLNTAVEAVVDRVGFEYHKLAGQAKDLGSAAVLVSLLFCVFVWLALLVPRYF
ncbi:diacylglycerol kinase [Agaribacterium haliotis]|uniref:diacylglycerol kinase n=1 Tax=Agaribacterium haliotis TaxID=2013869 RepID=UPI0023D864B2|nr:diacylglycerol kinase [Agaribacterium haliotis]